MSEHRIRLRGGWLWLDPDVSPDDSPTGRRVTLPIEWPGGPAGRVRLARSFGPPPMDPSRETLALHMARVGGLASARLNGAEIARPTPGTTAIEVPLPGPLPRRNLLVLEVDLGANGDHPGPDQAPVPWGEVALIIGPREPPHGAADDAGVAGRTGGDDRESLGGIDPGA